MTDAGGTDVRTMTSDALYAEACRLMPAGVNSPVRAYGAVGGTPPFVARGAGSRVWDVDGHEYVDYVGSWGPLIVGHAHPAVVRGVIETASLGSSFGAPTPLEVALARTVIDAVPSIELLRMVSSGTEATMSALRLSRAATGRRFVVKFDGCYHGHVDSLLARAGSGVLTFARAAVDAGRRPTAFPPAPACRRRSRRSRSCVPFNDPAALRALFRGARIARSRR